MQLDTSTVRRRDLEIHSSGAQRLTDSCSPCCRIVLDAKPVLAYKRTKAVLAYRIKILTQRQSRSSIVIMNKKDVLREHLSRLGKKGGPAGGKARMKSLTSGERKKLAQKAAVARWGKKEAK